MAPRNTSVARSGPPSDIEDDVLRRLAALVADMPRSRARNQGGDVYHAKRFERGADPYNIGVNDSSPAVICKRGGSLGGGEMVLKVEHPYCDETSGLCTVHINVSPAEPLPTMFELQPNGRLLAHVEWWAGVSGGACDLDITGGAIFTVAGTNRIEIHVEQVTAYEAVALRPGQDLKVQAQAAWGGQSAPPRPAYMTGLIQTVAGGVANNNLFIPDHAQTMWLVSDTKGATLEADIFGLGTTVIAHMTNRVGEGRQGSIPIVAGMRQYNVTSSLDAKVFAIFEMVIALFFLLYPLGEVLSRVG